MLTPLAVLALAASATLATPAPTPAPAPHAGVTLFTNVNVVPMHEPGVLRNHAVLVRDGRIVRIAPAHDFDHSDLPDDFRTIDGRGDDYLIPGLCDMHVHLPPMPAEHGNPTWRALTLLVANGVTTARGMIGHPNHIEIRRRAHENELLAPALYIAGPPLHHGAVKTPEDAARLVREHDEAGFDLIKSHRVIQTEIFDAILAAARERSIPVAGHVDNEVGLDHALPAGIQIEHLDAYVAALLKDPDLASTFGQIAPPPILNELDETRIDALARRTVEGGVCNTPTLALFAIIVDADLTTETLLDRPEMRYVMDQALESWGQQRKGALGMAKADPGYPARFIGLRARMVKAIRDRGGCIMAGSDSPQFFLVTGSALHRELHCLADAGLTNWEALEAATISPARYLAALPGSGSAGGHPADFGAIEVGRRADLVLLNADPITDISGSTAIAGVMLRGRWLDRTALDAMLEEVAASVGKAG